MGREQGDDGTFVIPSSRTKNKRPHVVPLPALARAIIASVKPVASPVGYVFTISGKSPVGGWSMIKNRLDAAMGTPAPWRLHDLRRTFVTGPADLGIRPDVIEMAVNHASGLRGGVTTTKASCCPSGERRWSAGRRTSKASWPGRQRRWCCTWCKSDGSATYTAKGRCASRGDDEHYCEHVKHFRRARVEAAYRASVDLLTTAWKENPEFGIAIDLATVLGRTEPLKEYLASDKPLTLGNRLGLIAIIERLELRIASLEERIASTQKRGRPQRKSYPWNATDAERNAALIVAGLKAEWRKEHGRQRVPPAETEDMINRAIAEAATAFGVPATSIGKDRIRIALKAGRI